MEIINSTVEDIEEIFSLYRTATAYQKSKSVVAWPEFDRNLIMNEINRARQWKLVLDNTIACVWATTFTDPEIWEEKDNDPAVYIHRIAANPDLRGNNFVVQIVKWARTYAKENLKEYIRMDTVGNNKALITYYQSCGFKFSGLFKINHSAGLPAHYHNAQVARFEINLNSEL